MQSSGSTRRSGSGRQHRAGMACHTPSTARFITLAALLHASAGSQPDAIPDQAARPQGRRGPPPGKRPAQSAAGHSDSHARPKQLGRPKELVDCRAVVDSFAAAVAALGAGGVSAVLDVGANDGKWSQSLKQWVAQWVGRHGGGQATLRQTLVEPQPQFRARLEGMAAQHRWWTFLPGAVVGLAPASGTVNLTLSTCSHCVSTLPAMARRYNPSHRRGREFSVPTIGLSDLIANATAGTSVSMLKLDIEGGEYEVLPHVLATGALCRLTHLLIEWHLNALPAHKRHASLSLRNSIESTLRHGCASPPVIEHSEWDQNNYYLEGPGLDEEASRHTSDPGGYAGIRPPWTSKWLAVDGHVMNSSEARIELARVSKIVRDKWGAVHKAVSNS